ncbi:MAG: HPr family phosphocarrier protein, partial [Desulfobacteraceae bacterium]|nr:HPr family phosphocarrier protein [Desulfobacteraceae bacterium]
SKSGKKAKQLRGHFSIVFHILQVAGRLLHFYERHLHDVGHKDVYNSVSSLLSDMVETDTLLDGTVNSCLFYAWQFLSSGQELALEIVNENMERGSIVVGIPKDRGFHSRPSMLVAKIVRHYGGEVNLCIGEDKFDASSVLDIQWAGGKIKKENIEEITFSGDLRALTDIKVLSEINYGEDSMGKGIPLPTELTYLH